MMTHWLKQQAHPEGGRSTWTCSSAFRWRSALETPQWEKWPVAATQLEPAHSEGRKSLWPWGARCWAVSRAALNGSCWHGYLGVPGPDLPPVHTSSLPVPSVSSRLRRTPTRRNAERHFSRSPRPSPLSWPPFQCLGMSALTQRVMSVHATTTLCGSGPDAPGCRGDLLPCRGHGQARTHLPSSEGLRRCR